MLGKIMAGAAAAGLALLLIPADPADARSKKFRFHPYYGGGFYLAPRYPRPRVYYYPRPRVYYNFYQPPPFRYYEFDDDYYEPDYAPPRKLKKKKTAKIQSAKKKTAVAAAKAAEAAPSQKVAAAANSKAIGCDKAQAIVGGYGFEGVKASDCDGQLYAFTATRGGKPYNIKLSSVSGELTEVKKIE